MFHFKHIVPAALLAVSVFVAPMAMADEAKPAGHYDHKDHGDWVKKHITHLHDALKITAQQEDQWKIVAQTFEENSKALEAQFKDHKQPTNAPEALALRSSFAEAHAQAGKKFADVFTNFYPNLSDEQKKKADEIFIHQKSEHDMGHHHHDDK